jgi:hypothetical protein
MCDMCETVASRGVSCDPLRTVDSQVIASDSQISVCPEKHTQRALSRQGFIVFDLGMILHQVILIRVGLSLPLEAVTVSEIFTSLMSSIVTSRLKYGTRRNCTRHNLDYLSQFPWIVTAANTCYTVAHAVSAMLPSP